MSKKNQYCIIIARTSKQFIKSLIIAKNQRLSVNKRIFCASDWPWTVICDPHVTVTSKRQDYLEWPDYFMAIAFLSAQRSKDPKTQVGACIVNEEKKIVGIGYNGMPVGCDDDLMPWNREGENVLETKRLYVCHAELNAVLNKNSADVKNCSIYVALFPCNECAKVVIQSGIKEVIYYSDKYHDKPEFKASRRMMDLAGVKYRQYIPKKKKIVIDFSVIERQDSLQEVTNGSTMENLKIGDS